MNLKVGDKIHYFYNEGNINNKVAHVRGFVDNRVILRQWDRNKNNWYYYIELKDIIDIHVSNVWKDLVTVTVER